MTGPPPVLPELDPTRPPPPEYLPDYEQFVTEDDTPVDNFFSEKQQRLLTEPIYSANVAARLGRPILVAANVGIFFGEGQPAIVPDVLVSLDVHLPDDLWPRANRSYFIWRFAKPPDAVIEIVSNREGGELDRKRQRYAQLGIGYYLVFDPQRHLGETLAQCYELRGRTYAPCERLWLADVGLGVTLWEGVRRSAGDLAALVRRPETGHSNRGRACGTGAAAGGARAAAGGAGTSAGGAGAAAGGTGAAAGRAAGRAPAGVGD